MRLLRTFALALTFSGCNSPEPTSSAPVPGAPIESPEPGAIVIRGTPAKAPPPAAEPAKKDPRISELERQARESQGKDNGAPLREQMDPNTAAQIWRTKVLARLAEIDGQLKEIAREKATLPPAVPPAPPAIVLTKDAKGTHAALVQQGYDAAADRRQVLELKQESLEDERAELQKELKEIPPGPE